jgi:PPOX class probable F420-dependent enzyme
MGDSEIRELLAHCHTMTLVTNGRDGWPHATAMWFAVHARRLAFMAYRRSQKCRNLVRDDRVTCMVEAGSSYAELRGVQLRGRATEVPVDERLATACTIAQRYSDHLVDLDEVARQLRSRIVYAVDVASTASWDHRKLAAASERTP